MEPPPHELRFFVVGACEKTGAMGDLQVSGVEIVTRYTMTKRRRRRRRPSSIRERQWNLRSVGTK